MLPNSLLPTLLPKPQFRAVLLAGYGVDLFPLVEPPTPSSSPSSTTDEQSASSSGVGQTKALLPVAGRKMIDWVLERVEQAGVFDILVLTPESISKPMSHHLRARRSTPSSSSGQSSSSGSGSSGSHPSTAKVELEEIPEDVASRGTVRVLMWAAEKGLITTDFLLLPCDLLLSPSPSSPLSLASLLDRHRTSHNLITTLFSTRSSGLVASAAQKERGPPEVLTVWDKTSERLLDVREMDEFDQDEVPIRTSLLSKYPSPTLTTSLLPTQLYIFSSLLLPLLRTTNDPKLLRRLKSFESVRDLVGWIARTHWRKRGIEDISLASAGSKGSEGAEGTGTGGGLAMGRSTTQFPTYTSPSTQPQAARSTNSRSEPQTPGTTTPTPALLPRTSWLDPSHTSPSSTNVAAGGSGSGGCKIVIWNDSDGFCARGNTVPGYIELNRAALKLLPAQTTSPTSTPSGVFISPDSFLHPTVYAQLGEKVGIKRCILGKGTAVGRNSKLVNCVLMEGCSIGENVKLDNCVISNGVVIKDRAVLRDCELGQGVVVAVDSQLKGEQLTVGDE
ncbi:translation initiation factor eIF2B subunit gamma [Sporobolomyces salmoneus]|uniref:translation initiation factor eIF2B subunit gamma n=1 Tax=Sporobolomyces salmoneus TaxID=183962 RepID=UPI0031818947